MHTEHMSSYHDRGHVEHLRCHEIFQFFAKCRWIRGLRSNSAILVPRRYLQWAFRNDKAKKNGDSQMKIRRESTRYECKMILYLVYLRTFRANAFVDYVSRWETYCQWHVNEAQRDFSGTHLSNAIPHDSHNIDLKPRAKTMTIQGDYASDTTEWTL